MVIPYQTAKLKFANTFKMAIWDPTAKFNFRQYFRLYGNLLHEQLAKGLFLGCVPKRDTRLLSIAYHVVSLLGRAL